MHSCIFLHAVYVVLSHYVYYECPCGRLACMVYEVVSLICNEAAGCLVFFINCLPPLLSHFLSCGYVCSWWACPGSCACWDAGISLWHQSHPIGSITDNCSTLHPLTNRSTLILVLLLRFSTKNRTVYFCIDCGGHVFAVSTISGSLTYLREAGTQHYQASEPNHFAQGCFLIFMSATSCL